MQKISKKIKNGSFDLVVGQQSEGVRSLIFSVLIFPYQSLPEMIKENS
jgi:hypothetical protein